MTVRSIRNFRLRALRSLLAGTALVVAGLLVPLSSASAEGGGAEGPATSVSASVSGSGVTFASGYGSQAQVTADSSPALILGFVFRDESGNLPTRVRAIGSGGAVCGTGNVQVLDSGMGFYRMEAAGAASRAGCPSEGGSLAFRLLYGSVDSGTSGIPSGPVRFAAGGTIVASLTPAPASAQSGWLGTLPTTSGADAMLTWVGADGTPIAEALSALGGSVSRVSHYDAETRRWVSYTPGGASFLQTYTAVGYGDVVRVVVK
jgi:hypothetical protein